VNCKNIKETTAFLTAKSEAKNLQKSFRNARYKIALSILKVMSPTIYTYAYGVSDLSRPFTQFVKEHFKGQQGLVGAEIGVFEGENAASILRELKLNKLFLVDPYIAEHGEFETMGDMSPWYKTASKRLEHYGNKQFIITASVDAVSKLPDNLDFVYIDAQHTYDHVVEDINAWLPKIKQGGVIGGHDFTDVNVGVVFAVSDLARRYNAKLHFRHPDWWFVVGEKYI
jgi:hypothetical protein